MIVVSGPNCIWFGGLLGDSDLPRPLVLGETSKNKVEIGFEGNLFVLGVSVASTLGFCTF